MADSPLLLVLAPVMFLLRLFAPKRFWQFDAALDRLRAAMKPASAAVADEDDDDVEEADGPGLPRKRIVTGRSPERSSGPPPVDLKETRPWLGPFAQTAIRLHPRPVVTPLPLEASKMLGAFLWPKEEAWPYCSQTDPPTPCTRHPTPHDAHYLPILQLHQADFPEFPFPPGQDLFQLLWCPRVHFLPTELPAYRVYWRRAADITDTLADIPNWQPEWGPLHECGFHPQAVEELPHWLDFGPNFLTYLRRAWPQGGDQGQVEDDLGPAPGTKLFGYPEWVQEPEWPGCPQCRERMELLLATGGHEATRGRWMAREDASLGWALANPSGMQWGDYAYAWVFYCPTCPTVETAIQSS